MHLVVHGAVYADEVDPCILLRHPSMRVHTLVLSHEHLLADGPGPEAACKDFRSVSTASSVEASMSASQYPQPPVYIYVGPSLGAVV